MNFGFDGQQLEFRSQLRAALERECTPVDLRVAFEAAISGEPPDRGRWLKLAAMGVVGLTAPEADGGLGLGLVDLVGLLEEAGRAGLPEPLLETAALAVPILSGVGADLAGDSLSRIAAGELIATVLIDPAAPAAWVDGADLIVVVQPDRVLAASDTELRTTPIGCLDATRRLGTVETPLESSSWALLAEGPAAERAFSRVRRAGAVATAAVLLGVTERLIELACEHAKNRNQFGRPIGSFQAVKHLLANAYVALEMARPVVYAAACALDDVDSEARAHTAEDESSAGPSPTDRACSMAKAVASDAAKRAAGVALQVHGAIGYTWEHDAHLWMKRAWVLSATWGDARSHYMNVLGTLLGSH
jgi:alkylation response protein AidB-like acyl-CoA dehydrogenase